MLATGLFLTGCSKPTEEEDVRAALEAYKSAILNDDGERALGLVDQNTRDWYETSLVRAREASKDEIMKLGIMDKLQVLIVRYQVPKLKLMNMTGESLFVYAVDNGWVGKNSVSTLDITEIQITDDVANPNEA